MTPEEEKQRLEILQQLEEWLELPVIILGFLWLILLVADLIWGLSPFLGTVVYVIWAIFVFDFLLRFLLAPGKLAFLKKNWLTALSLFVPALRVFRIFYAFRLIRAFQAAQGVQFVSVVGSMNRGMHALRSTFGRSGFNYVAALTVIVLFVGAAGIYAFEGHTGTEGMNNYGDALWYTSMLLTTVGSGYTPMTGAGRMLTLIISLYAFAVFSYLTATLASFFIDEAASSPESDIASEQSISSLRKEIAALRDELNNADPQKEP